MISPDYKAQVRLLLMVLPYVAEEAVFALKGGTAINLFHRDFPRLSVDIDLTYLPTEDRKTALQGIANGLGRIKKSLEENIEGIQVSTLPQNDGQEAKLKCRLDRSEIKIEVNTTIRGYLWEPEELPVVDPVQDQFKLFTTARVVSKGELYGGKICAALDRQHPRDLFDIKVLLEEEGITEQIRLGFIAALLGSGRPLNEMLQPNLQDQRSAFETQFAGMTDHPFTYEDFERTREQLLNEIQKNVFSENDKKFFISFKSGEPDWTLSPVEGLQDMAAVQWKLLNIGELKKNRQKHQKELNKLKECLDKELL